MTDEQPQDQGPEGEVEPAEASPFDEPGIEMTMARLADADAVDSDEEPEND